MGRSPVDRRVAVGGDLKRGDGELFWVHVAGTTLTPEDPFAQTLWAFTDLSTQRKVNSALRGSMTPRERRDPSIINGSRRKRIAEGSGTKVQDVNKLLKQFTEARKMMKRFQDMQKSGKKGGFKFPFM